MQMIREDPAHFANSSAVYNRILSIGSTFIDNGRGNQAERINGHSCVVINGVINYYLPPNIQFVRGGINYFTFDDEAKDRIIAHAESINDNQSATSRRIHGQKVKLSFLEALYIVLRENHSFCEELRWIGEEAAKYEMLVTPAQAAMIINKAPFDAAVAHEQVRQLEATIRHKTEFLEVAAFSADSIQENRTYYIKLKNKTRFLQMYDKEVEGLMYPLFFTHNENGFNYHQRKQLPFNQYLVARILQPEPDWVSPFPSVPVAAVVPAAVSPGVTVAASSFNSKACTNRFQLFSRLSQYYIVEGYTRAIDYRLKYLRKINKKILGQDTRFFDESIDTEGIPSNDGDDDGGDDDEDYRRRGSSSTARRLSMIDEDDDEVLMPRIAAASSFSFSAANNAATTFVDDTIIDPEREDSSSKSFLADSITGSPRHLKACALNALAVVSHHGAPTFFITLTCNPNWPELKERLPEGQTAFDRPDLTVLVFRARLKAMLHNLRHGKYFGGGKKVYILNVIEYQHRGLPHAHIVIKVDNCGDSEAEKIAFIDEHIAAYLPSDAPENLQYSCLIKQHMMHTCSEACKKNGKCKRGYMDRRPTSVTTFDEKGYPLYKRPQEEDLPVVPHNRQILMEWEGHSNVEFCGRTYAVMYLYKYLYKGNQKVTLQLNNTDDVDKEDEIKIHQRGRMVGAMGAMWCSIGYQMYPSPDPGVVFIKSKMPHMLDLLDGEGKISDLTVYFSRPDDEDGIFRNMKYIEFFGEWDYAYAGKAPKYAREAPSQPKVLYSISVKGKRISTFF